MMWVLIGIVLIGIAGGAYWQFSHKTPVQRPSSTKIGAATASPKPVKKAENANPYCAVSIQCKSGACEAAISLKGKRFLTKEAPPVPLPECNAATCQCVYARYSDRRKEEDERRDFHGLQTQLHAQTSGQERRKRRGRRKSDHAN